MAYQEVSQEEFSDQILFWLSEDVYPLEVIRLYKHFDDHLPTIQKYSIDGSSENITCVLAGSYPTRSAALTKVAELWDRALNED